MSDIWDEIFGSMDGFHRKIEKMMENMNDPNIRTYGYTMYKGPDGIPHVHEFGSGADAGIPAGNVREPLTDVTVDGDIVRIVMELPGVNKEDIVLEGTENSMTVVVNTDRKFKKTVPLPTNVDPNSAKAEYNNGILEIAVNSAEQTSKIKRISVD